ncbi:MmcQ/YjbR family DNA-binding protein [Pseudonocardia adelaidensis]|uniref:MmcQ/YjbR family DNA-binding protein n=1 Tax=Pseudonocardia adelaidensis TaxID=648754 RepID=A0ABP9PA30_9PSEU
MAEAADLLTGARRRCLALPEVTEARTHGAPTWFVRGRRSFVKFVHPDEHPRLDPPHVAIWAAAPPGARQELVAAAPGRFFAPRFGGRDRVGMRLDAEPDWDEVGEVIVDAYLQVAPTALVARLDV